MASKKKVEVVERCGECVTDSQNIRYNNSMEQVVTLVKSMVPIIYVVTHEEQRFLRHFKKIAEDMKRTTWVWSQYQGLLKDFQEGVAPRASGEEDGTWDPKKALNSIEKHEIKNESRGNVYIMRDFHRVLGEVVPRQLRDLYTHLIKFKKTIIVVAPYLGYGPGGAHRGMEPTLEKQITVVDFDLPNFKEIYAEIQGIVNYMISVQKETGAYKETKLMYSEEEYEEFTRSLQGLTMTEVENAIAVSFVHLKRIDVNKLLQEKKQIIRKSDILEYIDVRPSLSDVGGMDVAKQFFDSYKDSFTPEAKEYGVEPIRGVLFTGVPGTGKSLLSQAIAASWQLPLLRLDVGKVMTGLVGGSEQRMREAVNTAQAVAPCILWIDEIEKALSGTKSSNFSDGGTLSRVFGTLLTAMQEGMENVTVIATANDISALPPELIRRFNEVFFVDLPTDEERTEILTIHLKRRNRDPKSFDFTELIKASDRYTGAELEKAVKEAIARAWTDGRRPMVTGDLLSSIKDTKPISKMMAEQVNHLREWARERARFASSEAARRAAPGNQQIVSASGKSHSVDDALDFSEIETEKEKNQKRAKVAASLPARAIEE